MINRQLIKNYITMKLKNLGFLFTFLLIFVMGCDDDRWSDYEVTDEYLNENMLEVIKNTSDLSKFYEYLVSTGYDEELASTKSYTIWAPNDDAFANVSSDIINDTSELKNLIGYCITYSSDDFLEDGENRILMFNEKYATLNTDDNTIESVNILEGEEIFCQNGIIYFVDEAFLPKSNILEYLTSEVSDNDEVDYFNDLYDYIFDEESSDAIGVDEETGEIIYDSVKVWTNPYLTEVADMDSESDYFTFIVLSNDAFTAGIELYELYLTPDSTVSLDDYASYEVCSDLVFNGKYLNDELPSSLETITGVTVSVDQSYIDSTVELSNGIIYFLNDFPITTANKFCSIYVEGEDIVDASTYVWTVREVEEAHDGSDLYYDHNTSGSWAEFTLQIDYPATYAFYWVAVDDSADVHDQYLSIYDYDPDENEDPLSTLSTVETTTDYALESYLGDYSFTDTTTVSLRVFSDGESAITLDYIKLLPMKNDEE